jgi:hypothetical protein
MDQARLDAITVAIAASVGIEAYIWLQDIAGLDPDQAVASLCWTARQSSSAPSTPTRYRRRASRQH